MRTVIVRSWVRRARAIPDLPSAQPAGVYSRIRTSSLLPRRLVPAPARTQPPAGWLSLQPKEAHPRPAPRKTGRPGKQPAHRPAERLPSHAKLPRAVAENRQPGRQARKARGPAGHPGRALPSGRVEQPEDEARGRVLAPEQALHEKEPGKKPHPQLALGEHEVEDAAEHEPRHRPVEKLEAPPENPPRDGAQKKVERGAPPVEVHGHAPLAARPAAVVAGRSRQQAFCSLWPTSRACHMIVAGALHFSALQRVAQGTDGRKR